MKKRRKVDDIKLKSKVIQMNKSNAWLARELKRIALERKLAKGVDHLFS